ncbi:uncharacterized protein CPUR_07795 [Claviceps purpurea 20.1]|uniref:Uncharacterized protein n=1 Tax=Claviceps purpurea (strain 20.1) TaxID=1111077 RepID=M1VY89_CLAP2|nr:hypothetical protein E4U12_002109 [Claviceps purpurea]CCE33867.1 uncharacterized protein CPUR_07795 [Claviceps purpurea 20.1]
MKFSSVLGTFALATLEAYHVYAGPLEAISPVARAIPPNSYCCVRVAGGSTYGFPFNSEYNVESFTTDNNCMITVTRGKAPSQDGCKSWPVAVSCPKDVKAPAITLFAGPPC